MTTRINTNVRLELITNRISYLRACAEQISREIEPLEKEAEILQVLDRLYHSTGADAIDAARESILGEPPSLAGSVDKKCSSSAIVLKALQDGGVAGTPELMKITGLSYNQVKNAIQHLRQTGKVKTVSRGKISAEQGD